MRLCLFKFNAQIFLLKAKKFTNAEILSLKPGTIVRIKAHVDCSPIYKKGGELVFQSVHSMDDDEMPFGIKTEVGMCFNFSCNDYELTDKKIPLDATDMALVNKILSEDPKWIKAEKEETARQLIQWFCEDYQVSFKEVKTYQLRLSKNDSVMDIFPLSRKYHDLTKNVRGSYKDLLLLLCTYFKIRIR